MFIETQATPNPATVKFLPGRTVMPSGTVDFGSPEAAEASPLASALFALGDVTGVFLGSDFISVTRAEGGSTGIFHQRCGIGGTQCVLNRMHQSSGQKCISLIVREM